MSPEEQYPSADDANVAAADTVKACLVEARERVEEGWTSDVYIEREGISGVVRVCAVGAVFSVDGLSGLDVDRAIVEAGDEGQRRGEWYLVLAQRKLSQTARTAIALLNKVALERHPDARPEANNWSGPLEWVNQSWSYSSDETKREVLSIYTEAIGRAA